MEGSFERIVKYAILVFLIFVIICVVFFFFDSLNNVNNKITVFTARRFR